MNAHSHDRQNNFIPNSVTSTKINLSNLVSWLVNGCNDPVYHFVNRKEPQVWRKRDRFGSLQWCAYEPMSGRSIKGVTENEVRIWLENVLYR